MTSITNFTNYHSTIDKSYINVVLYNCCIRGSACLVTGGVLMSEILGIASYKGGVGKTTISAGIAKALAVMGKKVCLVDCKPGGTLDLVLGCQDETIFGLSDVFSHSDMSKIFVHIDEIYFCAAPSEGCDITEAVRSVISFCDGYDYIILDDPCDFSVCDRLIIVTTPHDGAVRCAEVLGSKCRLEKLETGLIINHLPIYEGIKTDAGEIIDRAYSPLIGAIPFMWGYTEKERSTLYSVIFKNIASRLKGENVPLFEGLKNKKKMQGLIK